ncbi:MAG: hypothetical protein Q4C10_06330 [Clostridia bacterium]|nr:hypothetical protein [Clostridia bacterium]
MRLCDEAITLYNAVVDPATGEDAYLKTVITGCSWAEARGVAAEEGGGRAADRCVIRIPEDAGFSGKRYAKPAAFDGSSGDCFTLRPGDLVARGEVTEEGLRPDELRRRYAALTVKAVSDNRRGRLGRHWRIECE